MQLLETSLNDVFVTDYVYIDEVSKLKAMMMTDYYDNNKECSVYVVPLKEQYLRLALAEPKGSQFLEIFNPM